jgi:Ca2+-binding RTX toxin-like protein
MAIFNGTSGPDTISGTTSDDQIYGGDGDDQLFGDDGNDLLEGGIGADVMDGGLGDDRFYLDSALDQVIEASGGGTDILLSSVSYVLSDSAFVEQLSTRDWSATSAIDLTGNSLDNSMSGNAGDNVLNGGAGADVMQGFGGNDTYYLDNVHDRVIELSGGGSDIVLTSVSYTLADTVFVETLATTDAAATTAINLTGNSLDNSLSGNAGANVLVGGAGADVMQGFGGNDRYYLDNVSDQVIEAAGGGTDILLSSVSYVLFDGVSVEQLSTRDWSATSAIDLTGNSLDNSISGNAGANVLDGGAGADVMRGFGGDDRYYVDNLSDRVFEDSGGGTDIILTSVSFDLTGDDFVEDLVMRDPGATTAITLIGNSLDNHMAGNAGANVFDGRAGADVMEGFGGNDTYWVDDALDRVIEVGGGTDRILADLASFSLAATPEVENLGGLFDGGQLLIGNALDNRVHGGLGNDVLVGGAGADILTGGEGNDRYYVDTALDTVLEGSGQGTDIVLSPVSFVLNGFVQGVEDLSTTDWSATAAINLTGNSLANGISGNAGANILDGGSGNDHLVGMAGADTLLGGTGRDELFGGLGADSLSGGTGIDRFRFDSALGGDNVDTITDFTAVDDVVWLDDTVFTGLPLGVLPPGAFATGTAAADADDRIIYDAATGALLFDADGVGGVAAVQFATLSGAPALTAADFVVV